MYHYVAGLQDQVDGMHIKVAGLKHQVFFCLNEEVEGLYGEVTAADYFQWEGCWTFERNGCSSGFIAGL